MPARHDRKKVHHGRRKKGSRYRRRMRNLRNNKKIRKVNMGKKLSGGKLKRYMRAIKIRSSLRKLYR